MKQLDNSQLENFDVEESIYDSQWNIITSLIDKDFPNGEFNFLDIGGGSGKFADRVLNHYPKATGTLLDNSELLLNKNKVHKRKTLINDSVENLSNLNQKYDLIFLNCLLHHLVGDSYSQTIKNISSCLQSTSSILSSRGRISIWENIYNGLLIDSLPSQIIFSLTSTKILAPLTRKMGANTAGIGVCFLSKKQWINTFQSSNLKISQYSDDRKWKVSLSRKILLHIGEYGPGHFWLSSSSEF